MSELTDYLTEKWGKLGPILPGPALRPEHEALRERLPEEMFEIWKVFGFAGIDNGRFWLCDPLVWQDAADAWVSSFDLAMGDDTWTPVVRSALGELELWGVRTGMSLRISPLRGQVFPSDQSDHMADLPWGPIDCFEGAFQTYDDENFTLYDDVNDKPLFEQCLAKLGPLSHETMYTFQPVPALGGDATIARVTTEKAVEHVLLLAELQGKAHVQGDPAASKARRDAQLDEWINGD